MLKKIADNPYFNAIKNINHLLDKDQKSKVYFSLLLLIINSGFDILGLSLILPITKIALKPSIIQSNYYVNQCYEFFNFNGAIQFLLALSALLLVIFIIKNIISTLILYWNSKFAFNVALRLSQKQFQYYYQKGLLPIRMHDSGKKTYNILNIPQLFASNYLIPTLIFSTELLVLFLIFIGMLVYNPALMLVSLGVVGPSFLLIYQFTKNKSKKIGQQINNIYPNNYTNVIESMDGYVDIKLSNKEAEFFQTLTINQQKINRLYAINDGILQKIPQKTNEIIVGLGLVVIFLFAYLFPEDQSSLITILALFGIAAFRVIPSTNRLMNALLKIKNSYYLINQLSPLRKKSLNSFTKFEKLPFHKAIELENVSYKYPDTKEPVLNNINLTIQKGEVIGIIGESGSGKTTLLNLLLQFLKETSGTFKIDNTRINTKNQSAYQLNIAYVSQNVFIKNSSIEENIAFGEPANLINKDKLYQAIKGASIEAFIQHLPNKEKTLTGENGSFLSGGQKQRIGIARALYKDAAIFIFDEATSALDKETEQEIMEAIEQLKKLKKTIVMVTHKATNLDSCDTIYALKNGTLINTAKLIV